MANKTFELEILQAAIVGYEHERAKIDGAIAELRRRLGESGAKAGKPTAPASNGRSLSPAARSRIAAAQKKRWAAYRSNNSAKPAAKPAAKPQKQKLSAEGRKHIVEALKKRWAAVKAAKSGSSK
jgi:hypothetical protein